MQSFYDVSSHRVRYFACGTYGHDRATERKVLGSEVWQFLAVLLGFLLVAVLWLFVVYLPGRTLERWEDQRPGRGKDRPSNDSDGQDGPLKPQS